MGIASLQDGLNGALDIDDPLVVTPGVMHGCHILVPGFKGDCVHAGKSFLHYVHGQAPFVRCDDQGSLGGIPLYLPGALLVHQ